MPDTLTKVTTQGYGSRITGSLKGMVVGFILFVVSFGVLFYNEGREDVSRLAETASALDATTQAVATMEGTLVAASGTLTTGETLGDIFINDGKYIAMRRKVMVYAWVEEEKSDTKKNTGGSETTTKTYTYKKDWVSKLPNSSEFQVPEGHANPPQMAYAGEESRVSTATFGRYSLAIATLELPPFQPLVLTAQNTTLPLNRARISTDGKHIFYGMSGLGTDDMPEIGDLRISYEVLPQDMTGTLFGKAEGGKLLAFVDPKYGSLYRFFTGSKEEAVAIMHNEFVTLTWMLRLLGFILMWVGLAMFFSPLSTLLDVLPFLGGLSRGLVGLITFLVALVLSVVTIIVSMITHSVVAIIVVAVVILAGVFLLPKLLGKKK